MTAFWRYWLLQVPGWVVLGAALYLAHRWLGLSSPAALLLLALWFVKDLLFYPLLARHYEPREPMPHVSLVGRKAISREVLGPSASASGYIELNGELWRARPTEDGPPIEAGEIVEIRGLDGLTLLVRRA